MLHIFYSIAPIFVLIVLGNILKRNGIPDVNFWNVNDKLVYWVLFPCLLFSKTSTMSVGFGDAAPYLTAGIGAFLAASAFSLISAKLARLENPVVSSVLQGGARHNTFIALAVAERIHGSEGLATAALMTAVLIPVTNVMMVTSMVVLHGGPREGGLLVPIMRDLGRNPLLLACALGIGYNATGFGEMPVLHETVSLLGLASLPIVLLCIGANLRAESIKTAGLPLFLSMVGKLMVFPAATILFSAILGLSELQTAVLLIYSAVPTASSAYTLARQMGGDAHLMAAIITIQTVISFVTLPLTLDFAIRLVQ